MPGGFRVKGFLVYKCVGGEVRGYVKFLVLVVVLAAAQCASSAVPLFVYAA